ncbi:MAG: YbaB/EbfC family nucleoid-associated protein [Kibdelosporangium sp.]
MDDAVFRQRIQQFEEQAVRAGQLKEQIARLKGSARNADGSVTVTVAPSGAVLGLHLSPAAMNRTHTQLTQEILGAIRQATQNVATMMDEAVRPVIGDQYYEQFQDAMRAHAPAVEPLGPTTPPPASSLPAPAAAGAPPADFGQAGEPARRSAPPPEDDDYFGDGFTGLKR